MAGAAPPAPKRCRPRRARPATRRSPGKCLGAGLGISGWIIADQALILPLKRLCIKETRVGGRPGDTPSPLVSPRHPAGSPGSAQPAASAREHKLSFY